MIYKHIGILYVKSLMLHAKVPDARCQVSLKSVQRLFNGCGYIYFFFFTIYVHGDHLCHVKWIIWKYIGSSFLQMVHVKFGFGQAFQRRSLDHWSCKRSPNPNSFTCILRTKSQWEREGFPIVVSLWRRSYSRGVAKIDHRGMNGTIYVEDL